MASAMSFAWLVAYEPGEGAAGRADKTLDAREQQAAAVQDDGLEQLQQGWKSGVDEAVDVLLTPTSPTTAFGFGAHSEDPLAMYLADLLTIPANMAGLPAISLPCGFDGAGLPIGVQLITGVLQEERLLQVAWNYEQAARVMEKRPVAALVP